MRRTSRSRERGWTAAAAAIAVAAGAWGAAPAQAALDPAVLEAVNVPEVAEVALGVAALLDSVAADATEQQIAAALHRYLADSAYEDNVLEDALAVVLAGDWTEEQFAALRSIFAEYAPQDLKAPGGGDESPPPPQAMLNRAETPEANDTADATETQRLGREGFYDPPPPPSGGGGTSDYRP